MRAAVSAATFAMAVMGPLVPASAEPVRAVVELFTSQGCSSCSPADEVLGELATDPTVVALSLPVDYWDRLGWKDTFASPAFTDRQRRYGTVRGDGEVYTPQAVVNGARHMNGANRSRIADAIDGGPPRLAVPVVVKSTETLLDIAVGTGTLDNGGPASVLVLPIYRSRAVAIGRGENANNEVTYTNIVREIIPAGRWSGSGAAFSVPRAELKDAEGVAVIVQTGNDSAPGAILGAALLKF